MRIKADWLEYLHRLRRREIEIVFGRVPKKAFANGLEIGAGDGFQSQLLVDYTKHLTCTEYDREKLKQKTQKEIDYTLCDAEQLTKAFKPKTFDLVFSSNLLEHLYHPDTVFADIHQILTDDGISIHIMPGPFVKLSWLSFFYPNQVILLLEMLTQKKGASTVLQMASGDQETIQTVRGDLGNNPKEKQTSWLASQLWPKPHGAYPSHIAELKAFRPARWKKLMTEAGFDVIAVYKMPVTSGYGFGLDTIRKQLEKMGFAYGYAYVAQKTGSKSKLAARFTSKR